VALLGEPVVARHRRTETTGKRRLTGAETAARRGGSSGDGSARIVGARTRPGGSGGAHQAAAGGVCEWSGRGGEREARSGGRARRAGQLSGAVLSGGGAVPTAL
jgi:hypothetical protein